MTIKPGGTMIRARLGRAATPPSPSTPGPSHLAAEFVVTGGDHAKRKMWSNIGLHSEGTDLGPDGAQLHPRRAQQRPQRPPAGQQPARPPARRIQGFNELDGIEFVARVDVEKDAKGRDRNVVKIAVEPDHPDGAKFMGVPPRPHRRWELPALRRRPRRPTPSATSPRQRFR